MAAQRFQRFLTNIVPTFLRGRYFATLLESIGLFLDGATQTFQDGVRSANPLTCETDALPLLCRDRRIQWYPTEPEASIRKRLSIWRQIKAHAGSAYGVMINLQPYFLPGLRPKIRIVSQCGDGTRANWVTLNADGTRAKYTTAPSNWDWDGVDAKWSRFWVIIYLPADLAASKPSAVYDSGLTEWDDGSAVWDGALTAAQIADIVAIINDSKRAASKLWGVILAKDPASFNPAATATTNPAGWTSLPVANWGYVIDNTTGEPSRLPTASFLYDLGAG